MRILLMFGCLQLLLAAPGTAQVVIDALEATHGNGTLYRFPVIGGDSAAAVRINTFLQIRELEILPGHARDSPFEAIWPEAGSHNGVTGMDYTLAFEQPGILAVHIVRDVYTAYPSTFVATYHFDARTGRPITLRDVLTPEGLEQVDAEITAERLKRVDEFLAGKPVGEARLRSDPEEAEEQKQLYRECRDWIAKQHPAVADALRLEQWSYALVREPCAPRVLQALDELDLSTRRLYETDQALLNAYGRCLLIERRAKCERRPVGIEAGVYRGRIAERYPITLVVEAVGWNGAPQARYFYDKQGKPIALRGSQEADGSVSLAERGPPPARFELRASPDGGLDGEWVQEGKAPQKVELR